MKTRALFAALLFVACSAFAQSPIQAQLARGHYAHNVGCTSSIYVTCQTTWTAPATLLASDVIHFHIRGGGAGGCPYQGGGGSGGRLDFDLTNIPPGTVFYIQVAGAGHGCQAATSGATAGGHVWVKYHDPNTPGNPLRIYSANGGEPDNAAGGGRGGQGCDPASGGCALPLEQDPNGDPNLIAASFLPAGGGDGPPADIYSGNAAGSAGQNTGSGAGAWGAGGGAVGPGGLSCTMPCNRGGQNSMWGYDGYQGLATVEVRP